jgi:hypothetical protein
VVGIGKQLFLGIIGLAAVMGSGVLIAQGGGDNSVVTESSESKSTFKILDGVNIGNDILALELVYHVQKANGKAPGVIDVYVLPAGKKGNELKGDGFLVDRIVPFSPPEADGTRRAVVQISKEARQFLGSLEEPIAVQIKFDKDLSAGNATDDLLSLEKVTVVKGK